jgi:hypothetical protein
MRGDAPFAARQYLSAEGSLEKGAEPSEGRKTREKTVTHSPKLRLCCSILALVAGLSAGVAEAKDETLGVFYLNSLGFFVQIGDENVHRVRAVMDEVFGDANFAAQISVNKTSGLGSTLLAGTQDFILWAVGFHRKRNCTALDDLFVKKFQGGAGFQPDFI